MAQGLLTHIGKLQWANATFLYYPTNGTKKRAPALGC